MYLQLIEKVLKKELLKRLNNEELEKFRFQKQNFESLELEKK